MTFRENDVAPKNIHIAYCMSTFQISFGIMKITNKIVNHIDLY